MNASHSCGCGRPAPAWRPRPATPASRRPSRIDPVRLDRATLARLRAELGPQAIFTFRTAVEALQHNKLRAFLTSLGILFGVASVIAMLAIGKGAERVIPAVDVACAEIVLNTTITREGRHRSGKVVGVDTTYFRLTNLALASGDPFTPLQVERGLPVAIIGLGVRSRFFTTEDPIGKPLKVGSNWVTVIGVLADRRVSTQTTQKLGIRDVSMDVYVPARTLLLRFRNRAQLTQRDIETAARSFTVVSSDSAPESEADRQERLNRNQLDRIIVRVSDSKLVPSVASVVQRMLARRHNSVVDFEITVPELLLKQEQRTKTIFNVVLGAIASISLVVGGIGIMNIMLASVLERIREIGVRRAVGATRRDILLQFLSEAVLISVAGGVAGILVGTGLSAAIERFAGIQTIVSYLSVVVAFGVSFTVGLAFGIMPAHRAARQDPVVSLRYE